jgi:hypothetical protein
VGQKASNPFLAAGADARPANPFEVAPTLPVFAPPGAPNAQLSQSYEAHEDAAPSRQDLLQRAVALGPVRMTWENIVLSPSDPILGEKMQPRVAERRARFRRVVKVALGGCVAFCLVAAIASAFSSPSSDAPSTASSKAAVKTAPAVAVVPVEKLEQVSRAKAPSHIVATAARPTRGPKAKRH